MATNLNVSTNGLSLNRDVFTNIYELLIVLLFEA